jgi:hypothetical protein
MLRPGKGIATLREGETITVQVTKEARFVDFTPGGADIRAEKGVTAAEREALAAALREIARVGAAIVIDERAAFAEACGWMARQEDWRRRR